MRSTGDPGQRHRNAEAHGGDCDHPPPAQRNRERHGEERAGGIPGREGTVAAALVGDDEGGGEPARAAELLQVPWPRAAKVILENHVDDQAGAEHQHQEQIQDLPAVDPAQVALREAVESIGPDDPSHRHGNGDAHGLMQQLRPELRRGMEAMIEEQSRDQEVDAGERHQEQGRYRETEEEPLGAPSRQVTHRE